MAWYKPGRDPNHPGDPPPKWAPLGKGTRIALLVTVIAGVVIALLIISARSADASDAAQHVEMPEAGLVASFRADWVIRSAEEGSELSFVVARSTGYGQAVLGFSQRSTENSWPAE
jgi:hypothetical protein